MIWESRAFLSLRKMTRRESPPSPERYRLTFKIPARAEMRALVVYVPGLDNHRVVVDRWRRVTHLASYLCRLPQIGLLSPQRLGLVRSVG
ncbi:hypothetical protein PoB_006198000 [Plakobranchus ocellatus]|uniref:Uncharacterized protein n=1 Tax=Plakobranchus ocellatus TaxID=259542 RepID=A0AAV4CUA0_9GAST|nr:hypothetical protein PoB_006198000 [Plakobranchus ocellatus]